MVTPAWTFIISFLILHLPSIFYSFKYWNLYKISYIRYLLVSCSCLSFCNSMDCSNLVLHCLPELAQTHAVELVMPSNHLILLSPQSFPESGSFPMSWLFTSDGHKYWSFSLSINPSNEYLGLISFSIDCFDLLAVQETLKSLCQYHSSKSSVLQCSAFFMVQLSHWCMTTGKSMALAIQIFVGKVMSLLLLGYYYLGFANVKSRNRENQGQISYNQWNQNSNSRSLANDSLQSNTSLLNTNVYYGEGNFINCM